MVQYKELVKKNSRVFVVAGVFLCALVNAAPVQSAPITQEDFLRHFPAIKADVLKTQGELEPRKKLWEWVFFNGVKAKKGYNDFSIEFMTVSYDFFDLEPAAIEEHLKKVNLDRVNALLEKC